MEFKRAAIKLFNKIKLRKINVLHQSFLWKRGHLHLEKFEYSECVEKVIIYLDGYKNAPLVLFFREEDNYLIKTLSENEKWCVGYPDQGIIWKYITGKIVPQGENNAAVQINLNNPSTIESIIKLYFNDKWKPTESANASLIVGNALTILDEIERRKKKN